MRRTFHCDFEERVTPRIHRGQVNGSQQEAQPADVAPDSAQSGRARTPSLDAWNYRSGRSLGVASPGSIAVGVNRMSRNSVGVSSDSRRVPSASRRLRRRGVGSIRATWFLDRVVEDRLELRARALCQVSRGAFGRLSFRSGRDPCPASRPEQYRVQERPARPRAPAPACCLRLVRHRPRIQEKSCDVEFGTIGVQFPAWLLLHAYPAFAASPAVEVDLRNRSGALPAGASCHRSTRTCGR